MCMENQCAHANVTSYRQCVHDSVHRAHISGEVAMGPRYTHRAGRVCSEVNLWDGFTGLKLPWVQAQYTEQTGCP